MREIQNMSKTMRLVIIYAIISLIVVAAALTIAALASLGPVGLILAALVVSGLICWSLKGSSWSGPDGVMADSLPRKGRNYLVMDLWKDEMVQQLERLDVEGWRFVCFIPIDRIPADRPGALNNPALFVRR